MENDTFLTLVISMFKNLPVQVLEVCINGFFFFILLLFQVSIVLWSDPQCFYFVRL